MFKSNQLMPNQLQANKLMPEHPAGFSALLTVLIVGVAALIMATSASLLGLGELDLGYTYQKGGEAFSVADGCMEETMRRLRLDAGYAVGAPVVLSVVNGSCTITVENIGGNQRRLVILGQSGSYYKKLQAEVTITPQGSLNIITLNSWEERSD